MAKKIQLELNDEISYKKLLQEIYTDSILLVNEATRQISILEKAVNLNESIMDDTVKYMKAMNDLIKTKDSAIRNKNAVAQQLQQYLIKSKKSVSEGDENQVIPTGVNLMEMMKEMKKEKEEKYKTKQ